VRARLKDMFDHGGLVLRIIAGVDNEEGARKLVETIDRYGAIEEYRRETAKGAALMKFPQLREPEAEPVYATARSLEQKRAELTNLKTVEIPANSRALQAAREMGDLRENFEYKAARQRAEYLSARVAGVPLFQYLGGPVRFKARIMARLDDPRQAGAAQAKGYRAFTLTVPPRESMTRLQTYVDSVRRSLDDFKKAAGDEAEVVLDGAGALQPGDAAVVARAIEREHPIWFDEPTSVLSRDALSRIVDESTVPVGLGRHLHNAGDFQNLLGLGCVDVIRPSLALNSLHKIRRMAAIAESHYIAVAPYHDGGPLATMFGVHLGASLSNFYIQEAPFPASARDREMRAAILGGVAESGQDGFAPVVDQPGLGVRLNEEAVARYAEETL